MSIEKWVSINKWVAVLVIAGSLLVGSNSAWAAKLSEDAAAKVPELMRVIEEVAEYTEKDNAQKASKELKEFYELYEGIENQVKVLDIKDHEVIEENVEDVKKLLVAKEPDKTKILAKVKAINQVLTELGGEAKISSAIPMTVKAGGIADAVEEMQEKLGEAVAAVKTGDREKVKQQLNEFYEKYEAIEAQVKATKAETHEQIEDKLDAAKKLLAETNLDQAELTEKINALQSLIATLVIKQDVSSSAPASDQQETPAGTGGVVDAATILLREGFEALLIFAALLAFLRKAGQKDKYKYLYAGALAGLAASFAVAGIFGAAFAANVANRELTEGVISLIAAVMLFYVSYWLISKANAEHWQNYIAGQTQASIQDNKVWSLVLVAFLAVFREGFETVLFFAALIPQIGWASAGLGMGAATILLVIIAVAILIFGMKIPIKPFFTVTGVLLYYLAFKFTGIGIHELQEGQKISETVIAWLPKLKAIGLYPTVETVAAQGILLAAAVGALIWMVSQNKKTA